MILGTVLIAGGAILIAVFGIVPEPTRSLEDLLELFRRPAFAAYFSTLAVVVVICLAIVSCSTGLLRGFEFVLYGELGLTVSLKL